MSEAGQYRKVGDNVVAQSAIVAREWKNRDIQIYCSCAPDSRFSMTKRPGCSTM
jgi:hypothetical protein